jgi:hypothetical protein
MMQTIDEQFFNSIRRVERKIHVIELYINIKLYRPLLKRFSDEFIFAGKHHDPDIKTVTSKFNTSKYVSRNQLLLRWRKIPGRSYPLILVVLRNPTAAFQKQLATIIKSEISMIPKFRYMHQNEACCVYYVESPIDFYPYDIEDIDSVFNYLADGLFFYRGRRGEHTVFQYGDNSKRRTHKCPTLYLGKRRNWPDKKTAFDWNVFARNNLHGIRLYYRPIDRPPKYIRLEYVANKNRLKQLELRGLDDLPNISSDTIRPLDYVQYRKKSEHSLHRYLQKVLPARDKPRSSLSVRILIQTFKDIIWEGGYYLDENHKGGSRKTTRLLLEGKFREHYDFLETVAYVDAYKELQKRYDLKHPVDRFFPKDEMKLNALKALVYSP